MTDGQTPATANPWGIVGADDAVDRLRHAIVDGQLSHAYLLSGPGGVGKALLAARLAQALVCEQPAEPAVPCRACRQCRLVESGESPDVDFVRIGGVCDESGHGDHAADHSTRIRICQVRRLERVASLAPFAARRRVFVVDAADDLQPEAAHALLKTLEEPPGSVLMVLLSTDRDALLPTVRSRCQEIALRPASVATLRAALEASGIEPAEARALATLARGRFGLALRMHADPAARVLRESVEADIARLLPAGRNERFDYADTLADRWSRERTAVLAALDLWREWARGALLGAAGLAVPAAIGEDGSAGSHALSPADALRALQVVQRTRDHLLQNTNPHLALEVMMLDLPVIDGADHRGRAAPAAAPSQTGSE